MKQRGRKGFTLIAVAACIVVLLAMLGVAADIGRMYITKNEAQTFADSAAVAAALQLDGTAAGLDRARNAVAANGNRWNFATTAFSGSTVEFTANYPAGPWSANPGSASGIRYLRVQPNASLPLFFLPALVSANASMIRANAVGGQVPKTRFTEGLFPFSPYAHDNVAPHWGLVPGGLYTLRWAASPKLNHNTCAGDNLQFVLDLATAGGGEERGFIESTSADLIRRTILYDLQTVVREVGDSVVMTGGAKQTQRDSLIERILQDRDSSADTYADYRAGGQGNGRRLVACPINTGSPDYTIVGIGAFFLQNVGEYPAGGNKAFCAEYVGAWVQGSKYPGAGSSGAYVVRLVE